MIVQDVAICISHIKVVILCVVLCCLLDVADKTLRLPSYDEVEHLPKDPPAYNLLYNQPASQAQESASGTVPPEEPPPFDAGAYPTLVEYNVPYTNNPVHVWAGLPAFVPRVGNVMSPTSPIGAAQMPAAARDIHISNTGTIEGPSLISPPEYSVVRSDTEEEESRSNGPLSAPPSYSLADSGSATAPAPATLSEAPHHAQNQNSTGMHDIDDR